MNDRGILIFIQNNEDIDYASIASVSAKFASKNLDVPVSIVTDKKTVKSIKDVSVFDKIILVDDDVKQIKKFYNGTNDVSVLTFKNLSRMRCYDLTPYEQTLVIDADCFILNDQLKNIWNSQEDFLINSNHHNLVEELVEFKKVSDTGIDFYWATAFYFKKNKHNEIFFNLCKHIIDNYDYYSIIYKFPNGYIRNDYVISVAIHILYGFTNYSKPAKLPSEIYYTTDRDFIYKIKNKENITFLIQKYDILNEYLLATISNHNIHIMNKYDLIQNLSKLEELIHE